jgi:hypothetical protein
MTLVGFPAPPLVTPRHTLSLVPSPKMDAPGLVAADCACGNYRSGPRTESGAYADGRKHVAAAVLNDAADILTTGLAWLYSTEQPDDAICNHLGYNRGTTDRMFHFIPDPRWPILVMELAAPRYATTGDGELLNPLVGPDISALCTEVRRRGRAVVSRWNGKGTHTVSLALDSKIHPTLTAATRRYSRGCPTHNTVFCGRDRGCGWYRDGVARLIKPAWPDTTLIAPHRIGDPA